jgi:hypothetical protein
MTAVKWLFIELTRRGLPPHKEIIKCFEEAKEMEKQQIIDAWINGDARICETKSIPYAEQYYNETYNNVQQP